MKKLLPLHWHIQIQSLNCAFRNCVSLLSVLHLEDDIELKLRTQFQFKPKAAEFIKVRIIFPKSTLYYFQYHHQITNHTTSDDVIEGFINQMNIQEPRETFRLYEKWVKRISQITSDFDLIINLGSGFFKMIIMKITTECYTITKNRCNLCCFGQKMDYWKGWKNIWIDALFLVLYICEDLEI